MISRRQVLKVLGMGSAGLAANAFFPKFHFSNAYAQSSTSPVLVTLYLSGGWDGAAIAQPAAGSAYDACLAARPTLTKNPANLKMITDDYGIHPSLQFFGNMFINREAIVFNKAGIAVRNSGSHEEATMDVISGAYDGAKQPSKGFVANILDAKYAGRTTAEFLAFDMVGGNSVLNDSAANIIKAGNIANLGFNGGITSGYNWLQDHLYLLSSNWQGSDQDGKVAKTVKALEGTQTRIREAINNTAFNPTFPNTGPGQAFAQAFVAIKNFIDLGLEAVSMSTGGFDTHNNQDPVVGQNQQPQGLSANLLQIDNALSAFVQNCKNAGLWDRVLFFTASEFGRTARENGSRGTDHGHGTVYLLAGGSVAGRQFIGDPMFPADYARPDNSFPVSVPLPSIVSQISEKMGVSRNSLYTPDVLAAVPALPPLFKF